MRPRVHCSLINDPFADPGAYADIMFERRALLFDLGDLNALAPRKLLRVSHAFVSHAHMDHFAGFDRLLRVLLGRDKTFFLCGPAGFIGQVAHKLAAYTWNMVPHYAGDLVLEVAEVAEDGTMRVARFASRQAFGHQPLPPPQMSNGVLLDQDGLLVRCATLDHGTPCLAFALEEAAHVNIWKNRLEARGLTTGPWLRRLKQAIQNGADDATLIEVFGPLAGVRLPLGSLRDLASVERGKKIAYVVDVCGHAANADRIVELARDADVLFIEAGFLHADAAQAARKNHLTARQAGLLARRAGVQRLVPFHFSSRYRGREQELYDEAQRAFASPSPQLGS